MKKIRYKKGIKQRTHTNKKDVRNNEKMLKQKNAKQNG